MYRTVTKCCIISKTPTVRYVIIHNSMTIEICNEAWKRCFNLEALTFWKCRSMNKEHCKTKGWRYLNRLLLTYY